MSQPRMRMRRPDTGRTVKLGPNTLRRSNAQTSQFPHYYEGYSYGGTTYLHAGYYPFDLNTWEFEEWVTADNDYRETDEAIPAEYNGDVDSVDGQQQHSGQADYGQQEPQPERAYEAPAVTDYGRQEPAYQAPAPTPEPAQQTYSPVYEQPAQQTHSQPSDSSPPSGGSYE